jgi:predicted nucleic acid-binding protein
MAHRLFLDTWAWLTLRDRGEARHSEVVMTELGISQIVTGDAHFRNVGMGIQTLP